MKKNVNLTEEELKKIKDDGVDLEILLAQKSRENTKMIADRIVKLLGVVFATLIFLISFSMLAPLTLFAGIFGGKASEAWTDAMPQVFSKGSIYYTFIGPSPTVAILIMTTIQIVLAVLLALLISLYVRDLIVVVKDILKIGKVITTEVRTGVGEGLDEAGIKTRKERKSLFDETKPVEEVVVEKENADKYDLLAETKPVEIAEEKPKLSKKEEKLIKEIEDLGGMREEVVEKVVEEKLLVIEKPKAKPTPEKVEEPIEVVEEVVEDSKALVEEINAQIDEILNNETLTTEEAQKAVAELEKQLPVKKTRLF